MPCRTQTARQAHRTASSNKPVDTDGRAMSDKAVEAMADSTTSHRR
jgi:hypothetical protein